MSSHSGSDELKPDPVNRIRHEDVEYFNEYVAPVTHIHAVAMHAEKLIGHIPGSEVPSLNEAGAKSGKGFYQSPFFTAWAEDHKKMLIKDRGMHIVNNDGKSYLVKHLNAIHAERGNMGLVQEVSRRCETVNAREISCQIQLEFIIATAKKVQEIQNEPRIIKTFSGAAKKLDAIEQELIMAGMRAAEVTENPKKCIEENTAKLQAINGGKRIPAF